MSEYQYYEFLALETPLDGASRKSLRRISSRAKISPHGFHVVYNWGDLKADPEALLARYFDVFVYEANWGTRRFACRLPASAFTTSDLRSYFSDDEEAPLIRGGNLIIDHRSDAQPDYWEDSSEWMGLLTPVRSLLLDGDLRPLYLRWLPRFNNEDDWLDDDALEPPVPRGLGALPEALRHLAAFLRIDKSLLDAAAEASPHSPKEDPPIAPWIEALTDSEKNAYLRRVTSGEGGQVSAELRHRCRAAHRAPAPPAGPRRQIKDIKARAQELRAAAREAETRRAEEARKQEEAKRQAARELRLNHLAKDQDAAWKTADLLIEERNQQAYDRALRLLIDLRDIATRESKADIFEARFRSFIRPHTRKITLVKRLKASSFL